MSRVTSRSRETPAARSRGGWAAELPRELDEAEYSLQSPEGADDEDVESDQYLVFSLPATRYDTRPAATPWSAPETAVGRRTKVFFLEILLIKEFLGDRTIGSVYSTMICLSVRLSSV